MIDFDHDAKLNMIGSVWTHSKAVTAEDAPEFIQRLAFDRVRDQLAAVLSRDAMQIREGEYCTTYEIRGYFLTPDQLEKYVQRRAMRMRISDMPSGVMEHSFELGTQREKAV